MNKFEIVSKYKDKNINLPIRATAGSSGYDFECAEDTIIPSYIDLRNSMTTYLKQFGKNYSLDEVKKITSLNKLKPTLIPTGIKCKLEKGYDLTLSVRSSCPLNYWLILANGVGIIDADYYNNESNEGEIFFQVINLSPFPIIIKKGEKIGQGVIRPFAITEDDAASGTRNGGFGSTSGK